MYTKYVLAQIYFNPSFPFASYDIVFWDILWSEKNINEIANNYIILNPKKIIAFNAKQVGTHYLNLYLTLRWFWKLIFFHSLT